MSGLYVVLEERNGRIGRMSFETLAAGHLLGEQLGLPVNAVLPGSQTEALAAEIASKKVARVVRIEHALLAAYTSDGFTLALEQFIRAEHPDYVVFPHTYQVRDYAPALAARFGQVLIGDVTGINAGPVLHPTDKDPSAGSTPVFVRQLMQGRLGGEYRLPVVEFALSRSSLEHFVQNRRNRFRRLLRCLHPKSKPHKFVLSPASHSVAQRRPSILVRHNSL